MRNATPNTPRRELAKGVGWTGFGAVLAEIVRALLPLLERWLG